MTDHPTASVPWRRTSIAVAGLDHGDSPFPVAVRTGPFVFSSAISGRDRTSGQLADSLEEQAVQAVANVEAVVRSAGGTPADIVSVEVFAADRAAARAALDPPWRHLFPDEASRPVRHTQSAVLPPAMHLQLQFVAVLENS